jgi:hypothetical protein
MPTRYRMFIDDTGEVDNAATNNVERRFASITGVIFDLDYYTATFDASFRALKFRSFGNTKKGRPPIVHRRALIDASGAFVRLKEGDHRARWDSACLDMYDRAQYTLVTVCVDKVAFYYKHPAWTGEIYTLLVENAIERYWYFLRSVDGIGDVMAESIGKPDLALKARYAHVYVHGTYHIPADRLQHLLTSKEIKIKPKSDDISGLQMADLLAKGCFDHCRHIYAGGPAQRGFSAEVSAIIEAKKYYRDSSGNPHRYGRIWRPQ